MLNKMLEGQIIEGMFSKDLDPVEPVRILCESCAGLGYHDVGDCEDGVTDECTACDGAGFTDGQQEESRY